jgi:hypothetical protein
MPPKRQRIKRHSRCFSTPHSDPGMSKTAHSPRRVQRRRGREERGEETRGETREETTVDVFTNLCQSQRISASETCGVVMVAMLAMHVAGKAV